MLKPSENIVFDEIPNKDESESVENNNTIDDQDYLSKDFKRDLFKIVELLTKLKELDGVDKNSLINDTNINGDIFWKACELIAANQVVVEACDAKEQVDITEELKKLAQEIGWDIWELILDIILPTSVIDFIPQSKILKLKKVWEVIIKIERKVFEKIDKLKLDEKLKEVLKNSFKKLFSDNPNESAQAKEQIDLILNRIWAKNALSEQELKNITTTISNWEKRTNKLKDYEAKLIRLEKEREEMEKKMKHPEELFNIIDKKIFWRIQNMKTEDKQIPIILKEWVEKFDIFIELIWKYNLPDKFRDGVMSNIIKSFNDVLIRIWKKWNFTDFKDIQKYINNNL